MAGRPVSERLSAAEVAIARRRIGRGESVRALARELGVAHSTLAARIRAAAPGAGETVAAGASGCELDELAGAAAEYVGRLEAAYRQAVAAIEALVLAIARLALRDGERLWEEANRLGLAPRRPEPWHVRSGRDGERRQLRRRFEQALRSGW